MGKQSGKIRDLILNALPESLTLNGIDSMYVRRTKLWRQQEYYYLPRLKEMVEFRKLIKPNTS